jgi:hypothetical protein
MSGVNPPDPVEIPPLFSLLPQVSAGKRSVK